MSYCEFTTDFYSEKQVTARRAHKCCECRKTIEPGDRYVRVAGKWDGEGVWSGAQHVYCYHFARSLNGIGRNLIRYYRTFPPFCIQGRAAFSYVFGFDSDAGCIPFEGVHQFLSDCDRFIDENENEYRPATRFWDGMISGCREKFSEGSGI